MVLPDREQRGLSDGSPETKVNMLVALNHHGLELNMEELKEGGIVLHVTPGWQFPERHLDLSPKVDRKSVV